ncbi:MAG: 2-aminoethylphosphonate--pyruvate transaminase [Verrucomicrobia bacterium]|nr:2-aminoethylphosphonate--pyruvate transaminase [Verrucomicrobiota bacterium]
MKEPRLLPTAKDKTLFTPGPLTTSLTVKQAMLRDIGSRDDALIELLRNIRVRLLTLAGVTREDGYETILMQGSGTFGVEAVLSSVVPRKGKLAVLTNGAYGERMVRMASVLQIDATVLRSPESQMPDRQILRQALSANREISHVAVVHCETTTGILNPIVEIGQIVKEFGCGYIVDAMSSFGAVPIDVKRANIDYLISSANKCIEGVPGFSFVIARREPLLASEGCARSLSLDLLGQLKGFEDAGQFRFTPPTHVLLAFDQALKELDLEGGVEGRAARYRRNHEVLIRGMHKLGFRSYLEPSLQSYIVTAFHYPNQPNFDFAEFYGRLRDKGMIIYPGKVSQTDSFRIGCIGRIFESDVRALLATIAETLEEMGMKVNASG